MLSEQIISGSFEFTLDHLVDHESDFSELNARFKNDETGASAYDPRMMLKILQLGIAEGSPAVAASSGRSNRTVCTQWHLFCLLHHIEKIVGSQRRGCR